MPHTNIFIHLFKLTSRESWYMVGEICAAAPPSAEGGSYSMAACSRWERRAIRYCTQGLALCNTHLLALKQPCCLSTHLYLPLAWKQATCPRLENKHAVCQHTCPWLENNHAICQHTCTCSWLKNKHAICQHTCICPWLENNHTVCQHTCTCPWIENNHAICQHTCTCPWFENNHAICQHTCTCPWLKNNHACLCFFSTQHKWVWY